jgi:ligand-binding sensor domain-containing protein
MKFLADCKNYFMSRLKKPAYLLLLVAVMILFCGLLLLIAEARFIYRKTELTLEKERQKLSKQAVVSFSSVILTPHLDQNIRIIQNAKNTRSVAYFQNSIFAATDGGLLQMTENGEVLRHLTVLDGLPESDLTSLVVFQSKLFIGTKSEGLLSFDGEKFEAFRLENHETKSITTLFSDSQTLFIGTFSGGLLEFDGNIFIETKALDQRIDQPVFLRNDRSCLIVGTFADGLWVRKNEVWKHLTTADGLLSNRMIAAEIVGNQFFAATDLGVSQITLDEIWQDDQTKFKQLFGVPTLSSFFLNNRNFYLTKENGEVYAFPVRLTYSQPSSLKSIEWQKPDSLESSKLFRSNGDIWFLCNQGIWKIKNPDSDEFRFVKFRNESDENELTDNNVSALLVDQNERLWIGTFRHGIDIFSSNGKKQRHLETDTVREINYLAQNADKTAILSATSGGGVRFGTNFSENLLNEKFPISSVNQILEIDSAKNRFFASATPKGLFFQSKNSTRIFSTINDLPGNSVFSVLFARNSLFAGTINGLAQIENGKVVRTFKTSNSGLKNNWISALCLANERVFIGTYGGGIFELLPSGEIRNFETEIGKAFINPNALFFDGERLFVGTLEGVWCLNLATGQWNLIKDILPSQTVLSITGNRKDIYFGTTNGITHINRDYWIEN